MQQTFGAVQAVVGGFNDLHTNGYIFALVAAILYVISCVIMIIENLVEMFGSVNMEKLSDYDAATLKSYLETIASYSKWDCFLRILDTLSSLMIIPVANNSIMARVMANSAICGCIVNMFEGFFDCGLVEVVGRLGTQWTSEKYHPVIYILYQYYQHATEYVFTIDSLCFAYFLFILGYLAHEKTEISKVFGTISIVGGICGMLSFLILVLESFRLFWLYYVSECLTLIENACLIIVLFWVAKIFRNSSTLPN
ncbi:hypothetical protein WA158_000612 [Blastocystis sp. Blastoise]